MRRYIPGDIEAHAAAKTGGFAVWNDAVYPGPALPGSEPKHLRLKREADIVAMGLCYGRSTVAVVGVLAFQRQPRRKAEGMTAYYPPSAV